MAAVLHQLSEIVLVGKIWVRRSRDLELGCKNGACRSVDFFGFSYGVVDGLVVF